MNQPYDRPQNWRRSAAILTSLLVVVVVLVVGGILALRNTGGTITVKQTVDKNPPAAAQLCVDIRTKPASDLSAIQKGGNGSNLVSAMFTASWQDNVHNAQDKSVPDAVKQAMVVIYQTMVKAAGDKSINMVAFNQASNVVVSYIHDNCAGHPVLTLPSN